MTTGGMTMAYDRSPLAEHMRAIREALYHGNQADLRCVTPEQVDDWRDGGPEETHYHGDNWRWAFCSEAFRPACWRMRRAGLCIRSLREWQELLKGDRSA